MKQNYLEKKELVIKSLNTKHENLASLNNHTIII